jgi:hypothetical protein
MLRERLQRLAAALSDVEAPQSVERDEEVDDPHQARLHLPLLLHVHNAHALPEHWTPSPCGEVAAPSVRQGDRLAAARHDLVTNARVDLPEGRGDTPLEASPRLHRPAHRDAAQGERTARQPYAARVTHALVTSGPLRTGREHAVIASGLWMAQWRFAFDGTNDDAYRGETSGISRDTNGDDVGTASADRENDVSRPPQTARRVRRAAARSRVPVRPSVSIAQARPQSLSARLPTYAVSRPHEGGMAQGAHYAPQWRLRYTFRSWPGSPTVEMRERVPSMSGAAEIGKSALTFICSSSVAREAIERALRWHDAPSGVVDAPGGV